MTNEEKQIYQDGVASGYDNGHEIGWKAGYDEGHFDGTDAGIFQSVRELKKVTARSDATRNDLSDWVNALRDATSKRRIEALCRCLICSVQRDMVARLDNIP